MKIDPQWISLAAEMPEYWTRCIVGNVNNRSASNPLPGSKWEEMTATAIDRQMAIYESLESMANVDPEYRSIMKAPLIGPRLIFMMQDGTCKEPSEFTHWWPIPGVKSV